MKNGRKLEAALIFSDRMVLQRGKPVPVWGTGEDGKTVKVEFRNHCVETVVSGGKWNVSLPPMEAGKGGTMTISCEEDVLTIRDVAVGEVWMAGGQSNMEFYLYFDKEYEQDMENGENEDIFFFDYPEVSYPGQINEHEYDNFGFWRPCTKEHMGYYSAVAYYFAQKLQKKYQVPIGIVGCNWGGTNASCWMSDEYLKGTEGEIWLDEYQEQTRNLDMEAYNKAFSENPINYVADPLSNPLNKLLLRGLPRWGMRAMIPLFKLTSNKLMPIPGPKSAWRPLGLYESMLKEVAPYAIRGVIWYQGESDDIHANVYGTVLAQMIRCWRDLWQEELPFLMTQIAPLGFWFSDIPYTYPLIREKQKQVSKELPGVYLTTIGDAGLEWDVHPKQKRPVGERLSLLAMGHVYGESLLCDPPECAGMEIKNETVLLTFANADGGLVQKGKKIPALECTADGVLLKKASVTVSGSTIQIRDPKIARAIRVEVKFATRLYHEVNVYNRADIPVLPFRKEILRPKTTENDACIHENDGLEKIGIWGKTIPYNSLVLKKTLMNLNNKKGLSLALASLKDTFGTKVAKDAANLDTYGFEKSIASGAESLFMDDVPTIVPFLVKNPRAAVIIAPGGGFYYKEKDGEGYQKAKDLNEMGVSAFVLDYRVDPYEAPAAYLDMQRAVRHVRYHADKFGVDSKRIGTMGFSAGGYIAGAEELLLSDVVPEVEGYEPDEIDQVSGRPDFMILNYPVTGFYRNPSMLGILAGDDFYDSKKRPKLQNLYALDRHLKPDMPPQFICYGDKDPLKDMEDYVSAVELAKLPLKKVIIPGASHGLIMVKGGWEIWKKELEKWLCGLFPANQ